MKQGRGIIIIVVAILVVAAVILVGYAYLETDVFKTPEQKFTKYLLGNYKQFESFNLTPFDEFSERALLESSKVDVNIKQKIDGAGLIPGSTDSVEGVTKVTVMTDPISKKQQTNLNITASIFQREMAESVFDKLPFEVFIPAKKYHIQQRTPETIRPVSSAVFCLSIV